MTDYFLVAGSIKVAIVNIVRTLTQTKKTSMSTWVC